MSFKRFILGAMMLLAVPVFAQQNQPAADGGKAEMTPMAQQLTIAGQLVNYGYQTKSALPLIQAAQIYQSISMQPITGTKTAEGTATQTGSISKSDIVSHDEAQLLADATKFAKGDKTILALINDTKSGSTRGAVGGARRITDRVNSHTTDVWTINFRGGELAIVIVSGDGDTDLDLYVYDENGNLIASDLDSTDQCYVSFTPRWTGAFRIKIKNLGSVYNRYTLITN